MALSHKSTIRLINVSDPPQCPLPAFLGPVKQSACFSICNERLEVDSTAALRYFVEPPLNVNLRDGLEEFMKLPVKDRALKVARRLDNLLKAEVVTWRGIMTKIILGNKLDLNVSYYRGVLYLEEDCPRIQFEELIWGMFIKFTPRTSIDHLSCRHKFEIVCLTSNPSGGQMDSVDLHTLWNAAIMRTLGSLNVLLTGEVDCVKTGYSENPGPEHYVELKTRKSEGDSYTIPNRNLKKWQMQSHLLGTPEIFVGFPDSKGIVRSYKTFTVQDMQSPQSRIDWGARVLHSLRAYCSRSANANGSLKVWRVEARNQHVDIRELGAEEVERVNRVGVPRNGIIPVSFIKSLETRKSDV
ncbi:hypothetical protein B0H13DRAFT_2038285 [Mycena leptocephala]|nr:hypothetical protein B0H13DRAFT_2038285 [Mycena leptocephala]